MCMCLNLAWPIPAISSFNIIYLFGLYEWQWSREYDKKRIWKVMNRVIDVRIQKMKPIRICIVMVYEYCNFTKINILFFIVSIFTIIIKAFNKKKFLFRI